MEKRFFFCSKYNFLCLNENLNEVRSWRGYVALSDFCKHKHYFFFLKQKFENKRKQKWANNHFNLSYEGWMKTLNWPKFHFFSSIQGCSFCITLLETCFAKTRQHVLTWRPVKFLPKNGNSGVEIRCEVWSSFTFNVPSPVFEPNGYKFVTLPRVLNTIVKINHLIRRRRNDMILSNRRFGW